MQRVREHRQAFRTSFFVRLIKASFVFMGLSKEKTAQLKSRAKAIYMNGNYTQKQVADLAGTTEKTLAKWIQENAWEPEKVAKTITRKQLLQESYAQLQAINEKIRECHHVPTKALSDAKAQCVREIEAFSDQPLHLIIETLEDLMSFTAKCKPAMLKPLAELTEAFVKQKEYGNA